MDFEIDEVTELRQRELEESKRAWERYCNAKKNPTPPSDAPDFEITMPDMSDERLSDKLTGPRIKARRWERCEETTNISTNVGIPEKRRGWERQDIQYHGSRYWEGEW